MQTIKTNFQKQGYVIGKRLMSEDAIQQLMGQVEQLIDEALRYRGKIPERLEGLDAKYLFLKKTVSTH